MNNNPLPRAVYFSGAIMCMAGALQIVNAFAEPQALTDPTRPASASTAAETHMDVPRVQLQAVLNRSGSYVAIVNGTLVRAGDRVGDITIQEVTRAAVRYVQGGKTGLAQMRAATLSIRKDPARTKEVP